MPISDHRVTKTSNFRPVKNHSFFVAFVICVILTIPVVIILSLNGNVNSFLYGNDKFGNICGMQNMPVSGINCSGRDMTLKPYARLKYYPVNTCLQNSKMTIVFDKCVDNCDFPYELIFNRCYPPGYTDLDTSSKMLKHLTELLQAISQHYKTILVMSLAGLGLVFLMFIFLRWYHTLVLFGTITTLQVATMTVFIVILWQKHSLTEDKPLFIFLAVIGLICYLCCIIAFIISFRQDFAFLTSLYDEALGILFSSLKLFFHSVILLTITVFSTALLSFFLILIIFKQYSKESDPFEVKHKTNLVAATSAIYIVFVMFWIYGYMEGWQNMLAASYFTKYYLQRFECENGKYPVLVRCHLGTIACGSFIVTMLPCLRSATTFIARKAYIQSILWDQSFCESNVQVAKILGRYWHKTVGITGFHYIFVYGVLSLILIFSASLGVWMNFESMQTCYVRLTILLGAVVTNIVIVFVMGLLSTAVDTVFLCFCQKESLKTEEKTKYLVEQAKNLKEIE